MTDVGTALDTIDTGGVMRFAMTPAEAQGWAVSVRDMKRSVLVDGSDYAVIPGTTKPSLLKPGAEMLLLAAGMGFTVAKVSDPGDVERGGVTYRASVHRGTRDNVVAECDGYAGYDEDRFFQSAAAAEAKERANAARWQRPVKVDKFVEYRAPWNSVVKMAQKRALVGAALNACAASGLFTQDLEDDHGLPPLWDANLIVKPYVDSLDTPQAAALKGWWKAQIPALGPLAGLTAEQGARVLVQIGIIKSGPASPPPPEAPEPPAGLGGVPTPPEPSPAPPAPPQAPVVADDDTEAKIAQRAAEVKAREDAHRAERRGLPVNDLDAALARGARTPAGGARTPPEPGAGPVYQPDGGGPPLPAGVTDTMLYGDSKMTQAEKAIFDQAWETHAHLLAARMDWLTKPRPVADLLPLDADDSPKGRGDALRAEKRSQAARVEDIRAKAQTGGTR